MIKTEDDLFWESLDDVQEEEVTSTTSTPLNTASEVSLSELAAAKEKICESIDELEARKQILAARANASQRRARNHRLYKLGELIEIVLGRDTTDEDIKKFETFLLDHELTDKRFSQAMNTPTSNDQ